MKVEDAKDTIMKSSRERQRALCALLIPLCRTLFNLSSRTPFNPH